MLCCGLALFSFLECIQTVFVNSLLYSIGKPEFITPVLTGLTLVIYFFKVPVKKNNNMWNIALSNDGKFLRSCILQILANHVMLSERQHRVRTSGFLLAFWLLMTSSLFLNFQSHVRALITEVWSMKQAKNDTPEVIFSGWYLQPQTSPIFFYLINDTVFFETWIH